MDGSEPIAQDTAGKGTWAMISIETTPCLQGTFEINDRECQEKLCILRHDLSVNERAWVDLLGRSCGSRQCWQWYLDNK